MLKGIRAENASMRRSDLGMLGFVFSVFLGGVFFAQRLRARVKTLAHNACVISQMMRAIGMNTGVKLMQMALIAPVMYVEKRVTEKILPLVPFFCPFDLRISESALMASKHPMIRQKEVRLILTMRSIVFRKEVFSAIDRYIVAMRKVKLRPDRIGASRLNLAFSVWLLLGLLFFVLGSCG